MEGASYESAGWAEGAGEHQDASGSADEVNMWAGGSIVRRGQKVLGEYGLHLDKTKLRRHGVHRLRDCPKWLVWFDDDSDGAGRASGPTGGKDQKATWQANLIMMVHRLPRAGISPSPSGCSCSYIPSRVSVLEGVPEGLSTGVEGALYGSAGWAEGTGEHEHLSGGANMWTGGSIVRRGQKVVIECGLHLDESKVGRQGVHKNNASDGVNMWAGASIVCRGQKVLIECGLLLDKTELGRQGLGGRVSRLAWSWRVPRQAVHRLARKSRKGRKSDHRLAWNSDNPFS